MRESLPPVTKYYLIKLSFYATFPSGEKTDVDIPNLWASIDSNGGNSGVLASSSWKTPALFLLYKCNNNINE